MIKFTMTNTETGETSEIRVCTTNYSVRYSPILSIGSLKSVEYSDPVIEFTMTGYLSATQMATLRRSEFTERGFTAALEPHRPIVKKSLDVRRDELLQQLLDTFKEKKDEQA